MTDGIKKDVEAVAKECLEDVRKGSPRQKGDYADEWRKGTAYKSDSSLRIILHNRRRYRLTHLLEKGHAKAGGGRVGGIPHIAPAEERAKKRLLDKVEVTVKK